MPEWVGIILLPASIILLGFLLTRRFMPRGGRWNLPFAFAALTLGLVATGWIALVLAEFGSFNVWRLLLVTGLLIVIVAVWPLSGRHSGELVEQEVDTDRWARWEWAMLAIWLIAALWLFFRPHEYIFGAADAGVYVSLGAEIARNGGFVIVDQTLADLSPEMRAAVLRPLPNTPFAASYLLPGFYVTDEPGGVLTPQFYPLHPVFQAIAYSVAGSAAGGMHAELLLTGLWILLGTLAIYLTGRDIGGPLVGGLVLAGLSLSALQIWFGRYPTSEALTQFLLWAGIWSGGRWLSDRQPASLWAFTAGCAFGAVFLVRIDSLILLPVFSLLLLWRWLRGWRRVDSWFAIPFAALVVHSLLHGHFLSAPYFYETVGYGLDLLSRLWPLFLITGLLLIALLLWLPRRVGEFRAPDALRRVILVVLLVALLAYSLYGWFLRPELNTTVLRPDIFSAGEIPVTNHENWLRLGWYLSPLGIWLGVLGAALLLWRVDRRTVLMLSLGLMFSAVYLWNISANPHHVYVMRRYVPAVMPFFILCGAYLLGHRGLSKASWTLAPPAFLARIPYRLSMIVLAVVIIAWLAGFGWSARGFVTQVDHAGLIGQMDALASGLPEGAILLFNDQSPVGEADIWGTPLRFVYGFDVFALRQSPESISPALVETIKTWQNNGRPVVWVGAPDWLGEQGIVYRTEEIALARRRLESSYERKPYLVDTEVTTLSLHYLESGSHESE